MVRCLGVGGWGATVEGEDGFVQEADEAAEGEAVGRECVEAVGG